MKMIEKKISENNYFFANDRIYSNCISSVLQGDGIFSTLLCFNRKIQHFRDHLERVEKSFSWAFQEEISKGEITGFFKTIFNHDFFDYNGFIAVTFSVYYDLFENKKLFIANSKRLGEESLNFGFVKLKTFIANHRQQEVPQYVKYPSYFLSNSLTRKLNSEILFCNKENLVTESNFSNFGIYRDNTFYLSSEKNILEGITEKSFLRFCKAKGINVIRKSIYIDDIASTDFCFLLSSIRGIRVIEQINDIKLNVDLTYMINIIDDFKFYLSGLFEEV